MNREIYDPDTGVTYEVVDDAEADFQQQLAERTAEHEAFLDRLENVVEAAEKHKGRSLREWEVNQVVSMYLDTDGLDEEGYGNFEAAAAAVRGLSDLDTSEERSQFITERLQEEAEIEGSNKPYSSLDEVPEPVQVEEGDFESDESEEGDE